VFVEDRLFATLDTRTRKWQPYKGIEILLSDTVGFVKKLPHHLVASFRATLEEAINADLLLHVVDASNEDAASQINAVEKVLTEIGCKDKPVLLVLNKVDAIKAIDNLEILQTMYPDAISISAKTGYGVENLSKAVTSKFTGDMLLAQVTISQSNGKIQSFLRAFGKIIDQTYLDGVVIIKAKLGSNQLANLKSLRPDKLEILEGPDSRSL
jgi:GTPase